MAKSKFESNAIRINPSKTNQKEHSNSNQEVLFKKMCFLERFENGLIRLCFVLEKSYLT
jgi:hypothetical protein